ncbi:MAG: hypothetical protein Q7S92_03290 [Candidatus Diapherotrites archaeon]|nr:hypothetical protein [Candidatus Diapherotrites archaeon]
MKKPVTRKIAPVQRKKPVNNRRVHGGNLSLRLTRSSSKSGEVYSANPYYTAVKSTRSGSRIFQEGSARRLSDRRSFLKFLRSHNLKLDSLGHLRFIKATRSNAANTVFRPANDKHNVFIKLQDWLQRYGPKKQKK